MAKQIMMFSCEICHITWRVFHADDEPYYCEERGELLYLPNLAKVDVFYRPTANMPNKINFK